MRKILLGVIVFLLASALHAESKVRNVAIYLYDGAEILDWTGPAEVLAAAGHQVSHEKPAFHIFTVAKSKDPITSQGFIKTMPDYSIADAPKVDVLVIPGGNTGPTVRDAAAMDWLRKTATDAEVTLTVCTGAVPIAKLGLLDGMEITTWYGAIDRLQKEAPKTQVKRGRRFVDNGKFITTAGVSAGIDGALHLTARLLGRAVASSTAQYMEYHWSPEAYLANSYPLLNPSADERGRSLQLAGLHRNEKNYAAAAEVYQRLVKENDADLEAWYQLARTLQTAAKHGDAVRAFERASASETYRANAFYNIACVYASQKQNEQASAYLARAVDAGFKNKDLLLNDPDLAPVREQAKVLAAKLQ